MTSSTNFLNKSLLWPALCGLLGCLLCGCAGSAASLRTPDGATGRNPLIAVLPGENLSRTPAPTRTIDAELYAALQKSGLRLVDQKAVDAFLERHWVRYVGGIDQKTAQALKKETGADAVLITGLELFSAAGTPRFGTISRLVSTEKVPKIIWMESVAMTGEDAPGVLGLGMVTDQQLLRKRAFQQIGNSLVRHFSLPPARKRRIAAPGADPLPPFNPGDLAAASGREQRYFTDPSEFSRAWYGADTAPDPAKFKRLLGAIGSPLLPDYAPPAWYGLPDVMEDQPRLVALVPYFDRSTRKHAGEILALHLAEQLVKEGTFGVLEFGVVRDKMLELRVITDDGISIPGIDLLTNSLGADLLIHGKVFDYLDVGEGEVTPPKVDFSIQMFARNSHKIIWSSHSRNKGDDGVFFYDWGRVTTAAALAQRMNRALVQKIVEQVLTY